MPSTAPHNFGQPLILEDFIPVIQPVTTSSPSLCAVCHAIFKQLKRCKGCKDIVYCSKECQVANWEEHKTICKSFTKSSRPTADHRRALFFAADRARPKFIWLKYGTDGTPLDIMGCFPNIAKDDVKTIAFHNRYLPYWIQLSYDGNDSGSRNLDGNAAIQYTFCGPVVALVYDAEEGLSKPALDADTRMLGPVLDYARLRAEYAGPIFVEQPQKKYTEEEWAKILKESTATHRDS